MPAPDETHMAEALALAARGEGHVEPNPMVGAVVVADGQVVGRGWHQRFGGPHAEIFALAEAGSRAAGGTLYVTLEPCCHHGKTPPCTEAVIRAGVRRVVAAIADPFPQVAGGGLRQLADGGIEVTSGVLEPLARELLAPYLKLVTTGRPWVIAKWAMSLDGKLATSTGDSRWISGERSRAAVHTLRGRMDAIMIGRRTAELDDPLLTARPTGARMATRIVLDSQAALALDSQLVRTARETPVLVAVSESAPTERTAALTAAGCETYPCPGTTQAERTSALLAELGRRRMTNVLVEGGAQLLGSLFDAGAVDELHVFIAPKIIGGAAAPSPVAGSGTNLMSAARRLRNPVMETLDGDVYVRGRFN